MPEIQDAMRRAAQEARAKNYVCLALDQRLEHERILRRIVLQIGILNNDEVSRGFLNAATKRCSLAHVMRLKNDADLRILSLQLGQYLARAILRAVVHADEFDLDRNAENLVHHLAERVALVKYRHDDGKFHGELETARLRSNPS